MPGCACLHSKPYRSPGLVVHHGMSAYQTDSRIDDYIATLAFLAAGDMPSGARVVHAADPEVSKTIKRTRQSYFTLHGNICALLGARDHLTIFIYDPPSCPILRALLTRATGTGPRGRFKSGRRETINQRALLHLFQAISARNRAGG